MRDFLDMKKIVYVGHCLHSGANMNYGYAQELGAQFHALQNLYGISVTKVDGAHREVVATILVKTDLGQTKEEVEDIYSAVLMGVPALHGLPKQQVTLRCTKVNLAAGVPPTEEHLVQMFKDIYTLNSMQGSA